MLQFDISTIMQVILVGHDVGGACISYAMEMFPSKVAKAVFLCAAMLTNGHSALDMFQQQVGGINFVFRLIKLTKSNRQASNAALFCIQIAIVFLSLCPDAVLTLQMDTNSTLQKAQEFIYSNGKNQPPTAINIDRALLRDLLFNQSPSKVLYYHVNGIA